MIKLRIGIILYDLVDLYSVFINLLKNFLKEFIYVDTVEFYEIHKIFV